MDCSTDSESQGDPPSSRAAQLETPADAAEQQRVARSEQLVRGAAGQLMRLCAWYLYGRSTPGLRAQPRGRHLPRVMGPCSGASSCWLADISLKGVTGACGWWSTATS